MGWGQVLCARPYAHIATLATPRHASLHVTTPTLVKNGPMSLREYDPTIHVHTPIHTPIVISDCVAQGRRIRWCGGPNLGFGSPHARNGRLAAVARKITVGMRGNDAQRAKGSG